MKRNIVLYAILSIAAIVFGGLAVVGFVFQIVYAGVLCVLLAVGAALMLGSVILQDNLNIDCDRHFREKDYVRERAYLEKKMKSPFFFLVRVIALYYYVCTCVALDDLPAAERNIDRLRHGGGAAWKYKTAYCYILIKLDQGDIKTARTEFEEFRRWCAHAEVYKVQLAVLQSIFERILLAKEQRPLPAEAESSCYPVVKRILLRADEENGAAQ